MALGLSILSSAFAAITFCFNGQVKIKDSTGEERKNNRDDAKKQQQPKWKGTG